MWCTYHSCASLPSSLLAIQLQENYNNLFHSNKIALESVLLNYVLVIHSRRQSQGSSLCFSTLWVRSKKLHWNEVLCLSWRWTQLSCSLVTRGNSFQIPRYLWNVYKGWPLKLRMVFLWLSSPAHRPHWSQRCSKNSPLHSANQLSNNCVLHECMHLYLLQHICTHADCCAIAGYRAVPFALC